MFCYSQSYTAVILKALFYVLEVCIRGGGGVEGLEKVVSPGAHGALMRACMCGLATGCLVLG